jgi:2-(1,2-epoxy-1,2-dihydrophenyl)acetyl-CoA isomerase
MVSTSREQVQLQLRVAVAVVSLNRPDRRNGVTVQMCEELFQTLSELARSTARVVVLRGAGGDFSVGADLGGPAEGSGNPELEDVAHMYHASTLLHTMPQVTIAAVDGGCAGAAMGWACACDFRFASDRARFSTAFLQVGVAGDMGLAWSLARVVGPARARELMFFPEKFTAGEALGYGLVTRVYKSEVLHAEVEAAARGLADRDPFALRLMKENFLSAESSALRDYIEVESARHLHITSGSSFRSRVASRRPAAT